MRKSLGGAVYVVINGSSRWVRIHPCVVLRRVFCRSKRVAPRAPQRRFPSWMNDTARSGCVVWSRPIPTFPLSGGKELGSPHTSGVTPRLTIRTRHTTDVSAYSPSPPARKSACRPVTCGTPVFPAARECGSLDITATHTGRCPRQPPVLNPRHRVGGVRIAGQILGNVIRQALDMYWDSVGHGAMSRCDYANHAARRVPSPSPSRITTPAIRSW